MDERDRRYSREGDLRAEALKIKEQADEQARALARADQTYKDEQANRLREQIGQERTEAREREAKFLTKEEYARRHEDLTKLVTSLANAQAEGGGRIQGSDKIIAYVIGAAGIAIYLVSQLH